LIRISVGRIELGFKSADMEASDDPWLGDYSKTGYSSYAYQLIVGAEWVLDID